VHRFNVDTVRKPGAPSVLGYQRLPRRLASEYSQQSQQHALSVFDVNTVQLGLASILKMFEDHNENSDAWHRPRRQGGDLTETRLFAFLRGSIWYVACRYRSSHGSRDTDPLQHVAVQHRILIPLTLLIVLPVVSSAVFLSVGPSLIARWIRLELPAPQPWLFVSP
jgi:hypothetical protein